MTLFYCGTSFSLPVSPLLDCYPPELEPTFREPSIVFRRCCSKPPCPRIRWSDIPPRPPLTPASSVASSTKERLISCKLIYRLLGINPPIKARNTPVHTRTLYTGVNELTQRFEDVCAGFIGVGLVPLSTVLGPFPFLLVAGLASVASPPVVALWNVHANVHSVVTCRSTTQETRKASEITVTKGS